ncbi:juvenile hormone epoxide hydrolase 1-like [Diprion similis]|uniref:juvenile hormone epoxide hydrolase 1-like n=1 Tax=Diprion similis TaxID=362088 RepID=UPI001EF8BC16|nr:juvenile hormone epoxide hydrolase 1-like [Diprion similis]
MWKLALVSVLLVFGIAKYLGNKVEPEVPTLPRDQYWGPGKPTKIDESIRPFKIDIPKNVIDDLKNRLERTRSLRKPLEGVGWTYGINSDYFQTIIEHWRTKYDWTKRQALLNKYPQFKTNIQGLDIHFYHVKPTVPKDASVRVLPLLMVHGWPGSVVEFQKVIPQLTTPRPDRDFVFELIVPSLPGYGFSDGAVRPGMGSAHVAVIMMNLMDRLGFEKFYTQGGDWGSSVVTQMGIFYPNRVFGTHLNFCIVRIGSSMLWTIIGAFIPSLVVSDEHWSKMYPLSHHYSRLLEETGYMHLQSSKPDTVGVALTDSPAGLAAYILEKFSTWTNAEYRFSQDGKLLEKFTLDELLDNVMVYWVTSSITTSMRLYAESFNLEHRKLGTDGLPLHSPSACALFPHELTYSPESLLRPKYPNLIQANHLPRGGHFAAFEEPQLLADDVWSFVDKVEASRKTEKISKSTEL